MEGTLYLFEVRIVPLILCSGKDVVLKGIEEKSHSQGNISLVPPVMGVDWEMNRSPLHWDLTAQPMLSS